MKFITKTIKNLFAADECLIFPKSIASIRMLISSSSVFMNIEINIRG